MADRLLAGVANDQTAALLLEQHRGSLVVLVVAAACCAFLVGLALGGSLLAERFARSSGTPVALLSVALASALLAWYAAADLSFSAGT